MNNKIYEEYECAECGARMSWIPFWTGKGPATRRKYCSDACLRAGRSRAMKASRAKARESVAAAVEAFEPGHCLGCGAELVVRDGPGRPRKYCGDACRRATTKFKDTQFRAGNARILTEMVEQKTLVPLLTRGRPREVWVGAEQIRSVRPIDPDTDGDEGSVVVIDDTEDTTIRVWESPDQIRRMAMSAMFAAGRELGRREKAMHSEQQRREASA